MTTNTTMIKYKICEQNSEDMTSLMKQQLSVVKSSLGAINNTLSDVEYNEKLKGRDKQIY
jgi:tetrahydromethanopterin S-methyltransferase subunit F